MLEFFITLALCDPSGGLCDYDKAYQTKTISVYENALMLSQSACRSALEKHILMHGIILSENTVKWRCGVKPHTNMAQNGYR
jgi:hypothetical protein